MLIHFQDNQNYTAFIVKTNKYNEQVKLKIYILRNSMRYIVCSEQSL